MAKTKNVPLTEAEVQPTWEYLQKQECTLRRNTKIYRLIQPLTMQIFAFNLLLVGLNFLLFLFEDWVGAYFMKLPLLPFLVESLPRGSWVSVIVISAVLTFVVPLAISGIVAGIFYFLDRKKQKKVPELNGSSARKAEALTNQAETVYEMRRKIKRPRIYPAAAVLTALTAVTFVLMFIDFAAEGAMALELVLILLALLTVLFVFFWIYSLFIYVFTFLNSLFYRSAGEWKLYELYHRIRAYWQEIEPSRFCDAEE